MFPDVGFHLKSGFKKLLCSQMLVFTLNLVSWKYCVHQFFLYAYNGALVSTNQIQSHKTFWFPKFSRHVFLCIWNDTNPEKLHTKKTITINGKNILWFNAKYVFIYSGQENNLKYIKGLFTKNVTLKTHE